MSGYEPGWGNWEMLGHRAMQPTWISPPTQGILFLLTTLQFTLVHELKLVETQENIEELCITMRDVRDVVMKLS